MMDGKLTDRLSDIGQGFLWAVHVIGPDSLHPATNYAEAVRKANSNNAQFVDIMEATGAAAISVPAIWPGTADEHRAALIAEADHAK